MVISCHRRRYVRLLLIGFFVLSPFARASNNHGLPGVSSFHRVDEHVFRGAQPDDKGFRNLAHLGIRTVVDLRNNDRDAERERQTVERLGMRFVRIPMHGHKDAPSDQRISQALSVLIDPAAWPVFVHCDAGHDRTGAVIACYRIQHDEWSRKRALAEALRDGMRHDEHKKQAYILSYQPGALGQGGALSAASGSH